MRLDKFLAQSGIGKKKDVREYIKNGLVKVNNIEEKIPAIEIKELEDKITYLDKEVKYRDGIYLMFNKPKNCVTATKDECFKTVFDYIKEEDKKGLFHVGRLDKDTEGLLFLTNDGEFENALMNPSKEVKKTYYFIALGFINSEDIEKLELGVFINKGQYKTKEARVCNIKNHEKIDLTFPHIEKIDVEIENRKIVEGILEISEGKKHQVKKMLKEVNCKVIFLKRLKIHNVELDENLGLGEYRRLTKEEMYSLGK